MEIQELIGEATEATGRVVAGADPQELSGPSPCEGWDARGVLNHLVGAMTTFGSALAGKDAPAMDADFLGDDPKAAYDRASKELVAVLGEPGVLDQTVSLSFGDIPGEVAANIAFMEVCVHGWDLARATGQSIEMDDATGEALVGVVQQLVQPQFREAGVFGAEQEAPEGASTIERAAAFTGRKV